jgi:tuberous sclerosis protein 2
VIGHQIFLGIFQVSDKSLGLPDTLRNTPPKLTRSEFHGCVFPVLASLASYHSYLDPSLQQRLIKCLEFGLVSRCARQCVTALTTCTLEMKDAMYKLLPGVLLSLSKISATVHIAIPILEFLSSKCTLCSSVSFCVLRS